MRLLRLLKFLRWTRKSRSAGPRGRPRKSRPAGTRGHVKGLRPHPAVRDHVKTLRVHVAGHVKTLRVHGAGRRRGRVKRFASRSLLLLTLLIAFRSAGAAISLPIQNGVLQNDLNANQSSITNARTITVSNVTMQSFTLGGITYTNGSQLGGGSNTITGGSGTYNYNSLSNTPTSWPGSAITSAVASATTAGALVSPGWVFGSLTLTNPVSQTSVTLTITNNVISLPSNADWVGGRFIGASNTLGDFIGSGAGLYGLTALALMGTVPATNLPPLLTKLANNSVRFNLIPLLTQQIIAGGSWSGNVLGSSLGGADCVAGSATYYQMLWVVPPNYSLGNTNCSVVVELSSITNVVCNVSVRFQVFDYTSNSFNLNGMYVDRVLSIAASTGTTLGANQMQFFTNSFMLGGTNDNCVVQVTLNEQFTPTNRYGFFGGWADFSH
jgi:hypothetical protein